MSATAALWFLILGLTGLMSIARPTWAIALYMATFFAAPQNWWWGDEVPNLRYALVAGFVLIVTVVLNRPQPREGHRFTFSHAAALLMTVNATFVHFFLAPKPAISVGNYSELLKYVLLVFLMWQAIRDKRDLRLAIMAIAFGAAYIGYEVTINDRGYFSGGRLEGVGAPGADSANSLACLLLTTLPLTGSLFVDSRLFHKLTVLFSAPLSLNVVLLCNSRGGFLGLIGAAASFPLLARGASRKRALQTLALGSIALFFLLGNPKIFDRFMTTFVGSEDRDQSAASRLEFWGAGLAMLQDYPLGAGGGAFKYVLGGRYLRDVGVEEDRSLHNGYLTEATSWGVQGLALHLTMILGAAVLAYRTSNKARLAGNPDGALTGVCFVVATAGYLIHCMFGSFLGNEWGFWLVALLLRYSELYDPAVEALASAPPDQAIAA
ncbi:hypothetical protein TBR22_A24280 [Luteitalea sp. TBR-22]|uniref:O-antigen ligase family protein n=1 Tax=Luteitalea sp. TBR-22 TaxID=2802971 RepID=UPI001AF32607|nr:O-antigen ligase family protein [Luteitalea sp. TBR-22]BCS33201.1 hypothetical protein TBR22_A24280 [Luteitalea sp. TBR-22]